MSLSRGVTLMSSVSSDAPPSCCNGRPPCTGAHVTSGTKCGNRHGGRLQAGVSHAAITTGDDLGGHVQIEARSANAAIGAMVDCLPIPWPFTVERFVQILGEQRSRPIHLVAAQLGASAPCSLLVVTAEVDYICYASNTSWLHQLHLVLHEVAHLLLGHGQHGIEEASVAHADTDDTMADGDVDDQCHDHTTTVPRWSATFIRQLLRHKHYDDDAERDAEVFATMGGGRIGRVLRTTDWTGPRGTDVLALRTVFDVPSPRRPQPGGPVRG
jgi:hypothetical protein